MSKEDLIPFQKGQSGNPKGRPPGKISLERALKKIMETPTEYVDPVTGAMTSGHYIDKHLAKLITLSASDDPKAQIAAIKEINDRYAGKARQLIEMVENQPQRFNFDLLTEEEKIEFDAVQNRYGELLSKCEIPMDEVEGRE